MTVRELPPLRLHVLATTPNGYTFRWGDDERRAENVPSGSFVLDHHPRRL